MNRRKFLISAAAAGLAFPLEARGAGGSGMERRRLGRTGERLSVIGLGGIVLIGQDQEKANRTVADAIDRGVNYFDVAPSYGGGEAERKMGAALKGRRDKVFLACKTAYRDAEGASAELATSLARLQTDHFDLYQLHGLANTDDVDKALSDGGAIETLVEARKQGKVRYLGFSAHSVDAALAAMDRFDFDTVLFPVNWACYFQGNFGPQVVEVARKKGVGVLTLKAMARCPWAKGEERQYPKCWYKPEPDPETAALALRFTLSEPITSTVPPGDERLFELSLKIAQRLQPLSKEERDRLKSLSEGIEPIFRHTGGV